MRSKMPKRVLIACILIILSSLFSFYQNFANTNKAAIFDTSDFPALIAWQYGSYQFEIGMATSLFCLALAIAMLCRKNIAREIYTGYCILQGALNAISQSYLMPQVLAATSAQLGGQTNNIAPGEPLYVVTLALSIASILFFTALYVWALNSKKARVYFRGPDNQVKDFIPKPSEVQKAQQEKAADQQE